MSESIDPIVKKASANLQDCSLACAKFWRYFATRSRIRSDSAHLIWCQLALPATLADFVLGIIQRISNEQMIGIYARPIVAFMKHPFAILKRRIVVLPGCSMRSNLPTISPAYAISALVYAFGPYPTSVALFDNRILNTNADGLQSSATIRAASLTSALKSGVGFIANRAGGLYRVSSHCLKLILSDFGKSRSNAVNHSNGSLILAQ